MSIMSSSVRNSNLEYRTLVELDEENEHALKKRLSKTLIFVNWMKHILRYSHFQLQYRYHHFKFFARIVKTIA